MCIYSEQSMTMQRTPFRALYLFTLYVGLVFSASFTLIAEKQCPCPPRSCIYCY